VLPLGRAWLGKSAHRERLLSGLEGEPHATLRYFLALRTCAQPASYPSLRRSSQAAGIVLTSTPARTRQTGAIARVEAVNVRARGAHCRAVGGAGGRALPALAVSAEQARDYSQRPSEQLDGVRRRPRADRVSRTPTAGSTRRMCSIRRCSRRNLPCCLVVTLRPELQPTCIVSRMGDDAGPLSRLGSSRQCRPHCGVTRDRRCPRAVASNPCPPDGVPLFLEGTDHAHCREADCCVRTADR